MRNANVILLSTSGSLLEGEREVACESNATSVGGDSGFSLPPTAEHRSSTPPQGGSKKIALETYASLLTRWNKKLNLVSPNTIGQLWRRHIEDCTQLEEYVAKERPVYDLGSGAGLPGLILSILGYEVTLVESDSRKCVFLQEAARECGVHPTILNQRVESVQIPEGAVITARAFAPLTELLRLCKGLPRDYALLKGEHVAEEIADAKKRWKFDHALHPSRSGPGFILIISNLQELS